MFYTMIEKVRDKWLVSYKCIVRSLIQYMEGKKKLRDAQIEAIKTYLFLKIDCQNKPLAELFCEGKFNSITDKEIDDLEVSTSTRNELKNNKAALALYEYAIQKNSKGEIVSEKIVAEIKKNPDSIDYDSFFRNAFYNVSYSDYLFSLPMGAGKTYLMAAFIYIDLYFANNEPKNPLFAHNFIILAPSGLKSSVVPSLKTIRNFDPSWVLPDPSASNLKKMIKFEVLDQGKTEKKSNKIKNPNVQKISLYQPFEDLFGLVVVTNAEKVILDGVSIESKDWFEDEKDAKEKAANELRHIIGKIPSLAIFIDEVHHATDSEKKLRSVVTRWMEKKTVTGVLGFSGTPYLEKQEKIPVSNNLSVSSSDISNTVYYYPLIDAIGNFLKRPIVKISNNKNSLEIVEKGIREFLDTYKDTVYSRPPRMLTAKLGIYCGKGIDFLEEEVFPLVCSIVKNYGMNPDEIILKFHGGNKNHPNTTENQVQFDILDTTESKKRIVLLCQIGKEGWDCRSLTGIILSQEGDCPTNMVLQTACRCLRQVDKSKEETALIYLNESNAEKLNKQLIVQQKISLDEFQKGKVQNTKKRNRYDRTDYLKVPPIDFYQLKVTYKTAVTNLPETEKEIKESTNDLQLSPEVIKVQKDFDTEKTTTTVNDTEQGNVPASFNQWIYTISNESFGFLRSSQLYVYETTLQKIFEIITYKTNNNTFFSSKYNQGEVRSNIRKAFYEKRDFTTEEELISQKAHLLAVANFTKEIEIKDDSCLYPDENKTEKIIQDDEGKLSISPEVQQTIDLLGKIGKKTEALALKDSYSSYPHKNRTFHYIPYRTDSSFEQKFLEEILINSVISDKNLEVYYNGDNSLTEFQISCYKKNGKSWNYVGMYTPDFLIIQRKDTEIHKAIIVETKGSLYANDPHFIDRKNFTQDTFIKENNQKFGYDKFTYLYLEDNLSENDRIVKTTEVINDFFV